ncbi:purine and uridine phosphorylase [Aureobasidium sp. EXF-8845]|nr:purine and uridine phosphorylase [Aureobasidium sp. EXF-8845]KAI4856004.1 purine and uridine phosphorylase [Aureobasidium sp. EXF-8846]
MQSASHRFARDSPSRLHCALPRLNDIDIILDLVRRISKEPESRDDFRVAIICALPLEAAAVLDLFDQRYDKDGSKYGKQEGDTNSYSTGCIGRHDIVLAHMPGIGIYSATSVALNIRLSFKEVNLALVVGVCGGAPVKQPIILGDVVISNSVVECYTGRHYSDGVQARKGLVDTLGRPNHEIRGLLSKFQVPLIRRELEDELQQNLTELCSKNNTLRYPGVEHDRLFAASYRHMHRRGTSTRECLCIISQSTSDPVCSDALESGCDELDCDTNAPENPSRRMRLASGFPTPRIHVGTVGATTVMKSGEHRDIMADENNIIAFEMEGAGVWEVLPCVIIKGVCDYADSHKNKKWQDYAAATAASGTKAFLSHWTSRQHDPIAAEGPSRKRPLLLDDDDGPNSSKRIRQQPLSGRQDSMSVLSAGKTSSNNPSLPDQADLDARKARLEALNFEQLDARHATIKAAHTATCEWLLSKSEYMDWQDEDKLLEHHGFLWIKGKPGAGKSTIMKHAYTNAEKHVNDSIAISYFFNARGEHLEKSTRGMYRSLLFQLLSKLPRLQAVLSTTEAASLQNTSPDLWTAESLQSLFRKTVERLEGQRLTCFVDALDECENNEDQVREMVEFFETLGECAVKNKIRLLVCFSSRHYPHITIDKNVELILELQHGHPEDIAKYVNSKLNKIGRNRRSERIKIDVQKKSQGIFLWVVLVIPMLQKAWDHGQVSALSKCLKDVPKDLDELFCDILSRDAQDTENLVLCLRWILYAQRPLRPEELYFAILSVSETGPVRVWDPEDITLEDIKRFILSSSKGLAEPTKSKTSRVQFIHESVRDFLLRENGSAVLRLGVDCTSAGPIHDLLKKGCQRYFVGISTDHCLEPFNETAKMFPFLDYSYKIRRYGTGTSLLYILTERNLLHLSQIEVIQSQLINAKGGRYGFPILAAAAINSTQMLELLLGHGADADKSCKEYKHALFAAVDKSNALALQLLMGHVNLSLWALGSRYALLAQAVKRSDTLILKILLRNRMMLAGMIYLALWDFETLVDVCIRDQDDEVFGILIRFAANHDGYDLVLTAASKNCKKALVRMFLHTPILRLPSLSGDPSGGLLLELTKGYLDTIASILLEHGTDTCASDDGDGTALWHASANGREAVVRMLLERGADVNASDEHHGTALRSASRNRHITCVRLLLEYGADVNKGNPLFAALIDPDPWEIACGTVVPTLLSCGADPNQYSSEHDLPLHKALAIGWTVVVKLLLDYDADISIPSSKYENAFAAARSCEDPAERTACEALVYEKSVVQAPVPYLTWVDGIAYITLTQQTSRTLPLCGSVQYEATGDDHT